MIRTRTPLAALALAALLLPVAAFADGGGKPAPPTTGAPAWNTQAGTNMSKEDADKVKAVELYTQAYREVDKAKQEIKDAHELRSAAGTDPKAIKKADDKLASATKRLEKARDKFGEVTTLDASYADGWNMLGFTRRKTGDIKGAFDAYWKCLALKPEHFGAHEYMGEAYLEDGRLAEARTELTWLRKHGEPAAAEAANLDAAISTWVAANPDAAAKAVIGAKGVSAPGEMVNSTPAPADSAR